MKKLILILLLCSSSVYSQWQLRSNGLPGGWDKAGTLDAIDRNNAAIGGDGIYITNDAGMTWRKVYNEFIFDITMVSSNIIYAVTEKTIIKTTNGGTTWEALFQLASNFGGFQFIKVFQNIVIAMTDCDYNDPYSTAQIYKSSDAGSTWISMNQNYLLTGQTWNRWRPIDFGSGNNGLLAYHYFYSYPYLKQKFAVTTDGGTNWTDIKMPESINNVYIFVVKMYNESIGVVYGSDYFTNAFTYVTKDAGLTWQYYPFTASAPYGNAMTFVPNRPDEIFLSRNDGLYYTANGGVNWTNQNVDIGTFPGNPNRIEDIVFVDENCGWMVTVNGQAFWTENKGNPIVGIEKENKLPTQYILEQNYPNPFNPSTKIKFSLPEAGMVTVKVFDLLGREIKTLLDNDKSAGSHVIEWNGDNALGQKVSAGIYMYSIITNKFMQTKKMVLLK